MNLPMAQTNALIETVKKCLRQRRITYADLAKKLNLSEANIKRMFSKRNFTLTRLDEVCQAMDMELTDLLEEMATTTMAVDELTIEAEEELVGDVRLLLIAILVINRWSYSDILETYDLDESQVTQLLAKLDRMRFIELLPGNRYRLLASRQFTWHKDGPVHRYFSQQIQNEFFSTSFEPSRGELLIFLSGNLSRTSNRQVQRSLQRVAKEFDELSREDARLPLSDTFGTSVILAVRPWELSAFTKLRKVPQKIF